MAEKIDFIADTSAIIGVLRRDAGIEEKIRGKEFAITFVTLAELSLGVLKAARPEAAWSRIQDVIGNCQMFHASTLTPAVYARIYFDSRATWHHDTDQRHLDRRVSGRSTVANPCTGRALLEGGRPVGDRLLIWRRRTARAQANQHTRQPDARRKTSR